jgi:hypothetical protein
MVGRFGRAKVLLFSLGVCQSCGCCGTAWRAWPAAPTWFAPKRDQLSWAATTSPAAGDLLDIGAAVGGAHPHINACGRTLANQVMGAARAMALRPRSALKQSAAGKRR